MLFIFYNDNISNEQVPKADNNQMPKIENKQMLQGKK